MNSAPPPSSFDGDMDFFEESRWVKLKRRLTEEPLLPLGCALTCWALYEATKSMRAGDKHKTNRMFRRRIYAQGFTLLAMLAGSVYWRKDRTKRDEFNELLEDRKKRERHKAWIKELEVREREEEELRGVREKLVRGRGAEEARLTEGQARRVEELTKTDGVDGRPVTRSVLEETEARRAGPIFEAVRRLWDGRR